MTTRTEWQIRIRNQARRRRTNRESWIGAIVLKGLSTVPAIGLFGYAWQKQRAYQQAAAEAQAAPAQAADVQVVNVALLGAGAQGQVLDRLHAPHPGPPLPGGLRHLDGVQPEARRQHVQEVQARGERVRRLPRDARQGEGARRGHHRHAGLLALAARRGLPQSRQARVLREGDVEHARGRQGDGRSRLARPASSCRSVISADRIRGISTATTS